MSEFTARPRTLSSKMGPVLSSLVLVCCGAIGLGAGSRSAPPTPQSNPQALVRKMVDHEEKAWKSPSAYFEYEEVDWSPEESSVSREIETPEGTFGSLITVNGQPPSDKRSQKEVRQLQKFVRDPDARRAMVKGEEEDVDRRMELLKEFPDAFQFSPDGPETNGIVRLKFLPNPGYRARSRNGVALRGTQGTVWIDRSNERLVRVEG